MTKYHYVDCRLFKFGVYVPDNTEWQVFFT